MGIGSKNSQLGLSDRQQDLKTVTDMTEPERQKN